MVRKIVRLVPDLMRPLVEGWCSVNSRWSCATLHTSLEIKSRARFYIQIVLHMPCHASYQLSLTRMQQSYIPSISPTRYLGSDHPLYHSHCTPESEDPCQSPCSTNEKDSHQRGGEKSDHELKRTASIREFFSFYLAMPQ
jgi:hypothetical protein